jgi:hypothetical protein
MRATEMHDLLADCRKVITESIPVWKPGDGRFSHIQYCRYCHYSIGHAHADYCLLVRLDAVADKALQPRSES